MDKPADMFDRDFEWSQLRRFAINDRPGATLGVISGRRRQGKTFLLDALCQGMGGFYFAATEATPHESLSRLGAELGAARGLRSPLHLTSWEAALDELLALGNDRAVPVVLDEFPYLARAEPSLPSVVQRAFGPRRPDRADSRCRLLLCGSALSFMGSLLSGPAPLRGRASLELVVPTLDYRLAAQFWGIDDPTLAVLTHAVVGGTPAYRREYADDDVPRDLADFDDWVARTVLNPASPLFREARYLLVEEPDIRDPALYHSVLAAVADGNTTRGGIANYLGRKAADINHPIAVLEDAGLLSRVTDGFRMNRTVYRIVEPLVTFYHAIMRPAWAQLERPGRAPMVWRRASATFASGVVGPHFEQLCRTWAREFADPEVFGGPVGRVAPGVVYDPSRRTGHEIDVVVFGEAVDGRSAPLSIGEAKWGQTMGMGHLERLRAVRDLLGRDGRADPGTLRLACYSGAGFAPDLLDAGRRGEVLLVDLATLYGRA